MKVRHLFPLLLLALPLSGCPKKGGEEEVGVEKVEGASTADKSGESVNDEMQEKKPSSAELAPPEGLPPPPAAPAEPEKK